MNRHEWEAAFIVLGGIYITLLACGWVTPQQRARLDENQLGRLKGV
jgi:hypothetical protein